jgi:hypothetical protein
VTQQEIEQAFVDAGWELDGSFSDYLLVGEDGDLSILVPQWAWEIDDPLYELCDGEREITYWVREIRRLSKPQCSSRSTVDHPRRSEVSLQARRWRRRGVR